jgi:putative FmdB family regulatory protein
MPAYDYVCDACEIDKEINHGMFENPEIICEKCGKKMRKAVSGGSGVIYRGQGWVSKGSGTNTPRRTTEVGVRVQPGMEDTLSQDVRKAIGK